MDEWEDEEDDEEEEEVVDDGMFKPCTLKRTAESRRPRFASQTKMLNETGCPASTGISTVLRFDTRAYCIPRVDPAKGKSDDEAVKKVPGASPFWVIMPMLSGLPVDL